VAQVTSGAARSSRNAAVPGARPTQMLTSCPSRGDEPGTLEVVVTPRQVRVTTAVSRPPPSGPARTAQRTPPDCPANTGGDGAAPPAMPGASISPAA
jgi:hypothetical protein